MTTAFFWGLDAGLDTLMCEHACVYTYMCGERGIGAYCGRVTQIVRTVCGQFPVQRKLKTASP